MGIIGDRLFGDRVALRLIWQGVLMVLMLFVMLYLFQTQCIDQYQAGYDACMYEQTNYTGFGIKEYYYPNGTLKNITLVPRGTLLVEGNNP